MCPDYTEGSTPRSPPGSETLRILILRAGAIGDTLMVTPLVRALRQTFSDAYLVFLCWRGAYDTLRYNPHLDEVIPLAYRHLPAWLSFEKWRILRRLRALRLDWGLALESHPRFLDIIRRANPARSTAYGNLINLEGFELASFDPQRHSIENHLHAAQRLGVQSNDLRTELHYPPRLDEVVWQRLAKAGIAKHDLLVGVHAGWGGRKHALDETRLRSWPARNFAEVIRWLAQRKAARVVLTGSSADRRLTQFIASLSGVPCLDFAGDLTLLETAALIRRLRLYLAVDSGPAHMAAALGTPLITLWGPAIFEQTAPRAGGASLRILYHRVHCAPCYGTPLMKICQDNICMKQIEVAEVQSAIEGMLGAVG